MNKTLRNIITLVALTVSLNGCLISRTVTSVSDHSEKPYTMVETADVYFPARWKVYHRFWQCKDAGDTLECKPVCDFENDEHCPWWSKE